MTFISRNFFRTLITLKLFILLLLIYRCNGYATEQINKSPNNDELFQLSIIHMNDFHARYVKIHPKIYACCIAGDTRCVGGVPRIKTVSEQLLAKRPNPIFLNAGDFYQGTIWHNVHHWRAAVHFMNLLSFDVMAMGNHDFDDGIEGLIPFLEKSRAPFVLANVDDSEEPSIQGLYKKSIKIERGGKTIGIIGVIYRDVSVTSHTGKLKFSDEVQSVNAEATKLKNEGVNIILVLSHSGIDIEKKLAAECPDIDIIVGGHSHTFLYNGTSPSREKPKDKYPIVVRQIETKRIVLVVQAGSFSKYLGNLTVWFNAQQDVDHWEGNPIYLDSSVQEDPMILRELKPFEDAVIAFGSRVVGEAKITLGHKCTEGECLMGNFITDAMVYTSEKKPENPNHWTYAAIGCINAGSIRDSIQAGRITYGDVVTAQPFENTWDIFEIKGEDLLKALEEAVLQSYRREYFSWKAFLVWSGVKVVYNLTKPAWSRVVDLQIRCQACEISRYESLRPDDWYRVITISNLLNSGESKVLKEKHRNRITGILDIDALIKYIERISPIDYQAEQRIQMHGMINPDFPVVARTLLNEDPCD